MTNFIPLFPLKIVVFPGEQLNLHIFEPRYKQLINDCFEKSKPFGIPSVIENNISEIGTLVYIKEISKKYEDGKMDIKTEGGELFRILEHVQTLPDKMYNGAIVSYLENIDNGKREMMDKIVLDARQLLITLNLQKNFGKDDFALKTYDIAHHVGMTLEQEYEFIGLLQELQRQEYLRRHLKKAHSFVYEIEKLKEKVKLNGHFKNVKGLDF
jgi:uncharacterized protein